MWQPPLTTRRSTAPRPNHAGNLPRCAPAVEEAVHIGGDEDFATADMERDHTDTDVPVWSDILDGTDHVLATRNGQHVITAWLRWHLAEGEFRRTQDFLSPDCAFCGLGDVQYKNW